MVEREGGAAQDERQQKQHKGGHALRLARKFSVARFGKPCHVYHDDGHVVVSAGGKGLLHQLRGANLGIAELAQDIADLLVLQHGGKAVRAQQQAVTRLHVNLVQIRFGAGIAAQRAGDVRALRVRLCLRGGDAARFHQVGNQAVIARNLLQMAFVQQIGARVAHLRNDQALAFQHGGRAGGSHAFAPFAFASSANDGQVRLLYGLPECGGIGMLGRAAGNGVDGNLRGNLASGVTTHAIAHYVERRRNGEGILVVVADAADVGSASKGVSEYVARGSFGGFFAKGLFSEDVFERRGHYKYLTRMATSPMPTRSRSLRATGS